MIKSEFFILEVEKSLILTMECIYWRKNVTKGRVHPNPCQISIEKGNKVLAESVSENLFNNGEFLQGI